MIMNEKYDQSARSVCTNHSAYFFAWYDEFCRKVIQANPEAACAFGTHEGYGGIAAAFCVDFSLVAKWA